MIAFAVALTLLRCIAFAQSSNNDAAELRFLHFVWRHGDRSPANNFSTNPDQLESWPNGLGELTKLGVKQQYELGLYLRQRYLEFLPNTSLTNAIHVRSTDYNRTIMSALANMAGMFPPSEGHLWNQNLTWQPIPVHEEPSVSDCLLHMGAICPKATSLRHHTWSSKEMMDILKENEQFISFLRNKTGVRFDSLDDIRYVYDPINCAKIHGHALPEWLTEDVFEEIVRLFKLSTTFWVRGPQEKRLRGALLLEDITERMAAVYRMNHSSSLKLYAYSAHDETLVALLENLEIYNASLFPTYASVIIFELYAVEGRPYVKILMKIGPTQPEAVPLKLHFCDTLCPFDIFYDHFSGIAPKNWRKECGLESAIIAWKSCALIAFALAAIAISAASAQALYFVALRRRNQGEYFHQRLC